MGTRRWGPGTGATVGTRFPRPMATLSPRNGPSLHHTGCRTCGQPVVWPQERGIFQVDGCPPCLRSASTSIRGFRECLIQWPVVPHNSTVSDQGTHLAATEMQEQAYDQGARVSHRPPRSCQPRRVLGGLRRLRALWEEMLREDGVRPAGGGTCTESKPSVRGCASIRTT